MFAKLNHVAIVSDNYARLAVFYRALFGLRSKSHAKYEASAFSISDGYVGMNVNPRVAGRQAGFDHFGIQVEDVELVRQRVQKKYPKIEIIKRPGNRPYAAYGMHDPAGNYFDLSQPGLENRDQVYEAEAWEQRRRFSHFAIRALEPERLATFYADLFELAPRNTSEPGSYQLSDGRMTLVLLPWRIADFLGTGIERPAPDHLGFEVESIETLKQELTQMQTVNPDMRPKPTGVGPEGKARLALFERSGCGSFHFADPDGVLLAVSEARAA